jgi:hypothetical protein
MQPQKLHIWMKKCKLFFSLNGAEKKNRDFCRVNKLLRNLTVFELKLLTSMCTTRLKVTFTCGLAVDNQ